MAEISSVTMSPGKALLNTKSIVTMLLISAVYLLLSRILVGYKPDQVFLAVLANALYFASRVSRKLITGFSVFIVYWVIFDYMKAFPNYRYSQVHIGSLYELEKSIFGFTVSGNVVTPNEYWAIYHSAFLDVLSGIFYLTWVPVPMAFAIYLFFKKKDQFVYFCLSFLLINLIGFVVYYIYPAAPPWYVQQHGFDFIANTPGNTGGLSRFDTFFHTPVFSSIYEKSSNVFAAMPSLHSSYPVLVLYYGLKNRLGRINILFALLTLGIWFSAVYTSHHYVLDVLAGLCCAITGIVSFKLLSRGGPVQWLSQNLVRATS
jgi:membrane-associated phospholipid phosphatase